MHSRSVDLCVCILIKKFNFSLDSLPCAVGCKMSICSDKRRVGVTVVVPSCSGEAPVVADGEAVTTEVLEMEVRIRVHILGSAVLVVCGGSVATVRE